MTIDLKEWNKMMEERKASVTHTTQLTDDSEDTYLLDVRTLDMMGDVLVKEHSIPHGFYEAGKPTSRSMERELMLICSEMFELFEDERNGKTQSDKIPEFTIWEEEFADIVIRVLTAAHQRGLRLGAAVLAKHKFNLTRPIKHGKKF